MLLIEGKGSKRICCDSRALAGLGVQVIYLLSHEAVPRARRCLAPEGARAEHRTGEPGLSSAAVALVRRGYSK